MSETTPAPATPKTQIGAIHYFGRRITAAIDRNPEALTGAEEDLLQAYSLLVGVAEYTEDRADRDEEHEKGLHAAGPVDRCPSCDREQGAAGDVAEEDEAYARHEVWKAANEAVAA
jgi:hypothetical protein